MMGAAGGRCTRTELLRMKSSGDEREFSQWARDNLLARGHEVEIFGRAYAEKLLGEDLYRVTATDDEDYLLASYDGLTMGEEVACEVKLWNEPLAAQLRAGELTDPLYYWQLEQQILVGVERVIFVVTDGTPEKTLHLEYRAVPGRAKQLMAGWKQFDEDLANFQHVEVIPKAVPDPVRDLPAILIDVRIERDEADEAGGKIAIVSTLKKFGEQLTAYLKGLPEKPENDQDFANLEQAVKNLKTAEERLEAAEASALSRFTTVEEMRSTVAMLRDAARDNRLRIDKLVTARKAQIREEIRIDGLTKFGEHIAKLNARLGGAYMPVIAHEFAEVMKGKKTVASLRDAVATELARLKILSNEVADRIDVNVKLVRSDENKTYLALFPDLVSICAKPCEDFANLVARRITEHKEAEKNRLEGERERIRLEEEGKARAKVEAEARAASLPAPAVAPSPAPAARLAPATVVGTPPYEINRLPPAVQSKPTRPIDDEIISVLALHYRVHESQVIAWLIEMDLESASTRMAKEFAA